MIKFDKIKNIKEQEKQKIWTTIKQLASEQFSIGIEDITIEKDPLVDGYWQYFKSSLSSSSNDLKDDYYLDKIELIMKVEEEFNIEINDEKAETIYSIQDLLNVVIFCLEQNS